MLVLSRKIDQQIQIGDDILVTVVRVDGNRVRLGISAPRDIRILRGELAAEEPESFELTERDFAFAHQSASEKISRDQNRVLETSEPQLFAGSVSSDGTKVSLDKTKSGKSKSAPLSGFVSAS